MCMYKYQPIFKILVFNIKKVRCPEMNLEINIRYLTIIQSDMVSASCIGMAEIENLGF